MTLQNQIDALLKITNGEHVNTSPARVWVKLPNGEEMFLHGWAIKNFIKLNNQIIESVQRRNDQANVTNADEATPALKISRAQALTVNNAVAARQAWRVLFQ